MRQIKDSNSEYVQCENSNLRFHGTKLDRNGNECAVFSTPNHNTFSIQRNSLWGTQSWNTGSKSTMDAETFLEKNPKVTLESLERAVIKSANETNAAWGKNIRVHNKQILDSRKIKDMKTLTLEQERELVGKAYNIAVRKLEQIQSGTYTEDDLDDYTIKELELLIDQFPYGISAQKDLLYLCIKLGWIKEDIVSDSRKIKDENTMDVLDGVLFIAFEDGTEDDMIAEVNKHKNESGKIDGVQYETYETDSDDGVAMIDLCAATGDANGFVKALLNEWGIADNVIDLEFQASDEMKEAVNDSRKVSDYRNPLDAIENAFNSVANELGTEHLSPKFYEKVNKYIKTYPVAEGGNSCTIVYQGAEYNVSYDFRDNRFYATKDEWNLSEAIEKRRKLLGVSDSRKVNDMTKPAHLRGYAEKVRANRRKKNDEQDDEKETEKQDVADSRRVRDMVSPRHFSKGNTNGSDYCPYVVFEDGEFVEEFYLDFDAIDFAEVLASRNGGALVEVVKCEDTGVCEETVWSSDWDDERDSWGVL